MLHIIRIFKINKYINLFRILHTLTYATLRWLHAMFEQMIQLNKRNIKFKHSIEYLKKKN